MAYDEYPQDPHKSYPGILHVVLDPNNGRPQLYSLEQIIIKALDGDANCREWLHGDDPTIPRIPKSEIPKGYLRCSRCEKWKPVVLFSDDSKNTGRGGKHSHCKRCRADAKYEKEHQKMMLRIASVAAVIAGLKTKVT